MESLDSKELELNSLDDPLEHILLEDSPSDDEDKKCLAWLETNSKEFTQEVPLKSLELSYQEYTKPKSLIEEPTKLELKICLLIWNMTIWVYLRLYLSLFQLSSPKIKKKRHLWFWKCRGRVQDKLFHLFKSQVVGFVGIIGS